MRRVILLVSLAAIAALCVAVAPTAAAPPTRAEFNALKNKVNRLQARVVAIEACSEVVVPIGRFGVGTEGYLYGMFTSPTSFTGFVTTALDEVDDLTGLVPGSDFLWFQIVDPACVEETTGRIGTLAARPMPDAANRVSFRIATIAR